MRRRSSNLRRNVLIGYFLSFFVFLLTGLSSAGAIEYEISTQIEIPAINLTSDVTEIELKENKLETPDLIVGSFASATNKTFLVGHSSTVFQRLKEINLGDEIKYSDKKYVVKNTTVLAKAEISMCELLKSSEVDTLVIMTCSGEDLGNGDATHRLIVTAEII